MRSDHQQNTSIYPMPSLTHDKLFFTVYTANFAAIQVYKCQQLTTASIRTALGLGGNKAHVSPVTSLRVNNKQSVAQRCLTSKNVNRKRGTKRYYRSNARG